MTRRLTHRLTDSLPEPAQQVLWDGIKTRLPYRVITANLAALGFTVPERSISRLATGWRAEESRKHAVEELSRLGLASSAWP